MPFDTATKTTDIMMFNSRNLGALIVDKKPEVKSWDEPQYDIQNIAIEESYGFGVLNEGQAIAVARNIKVRANEMVPQARLIISIGPTTLTSGLWRCLASAHSIQHSLGESPLARVRRVEIHCRKSRVGTREMSSVDAGSGLVQAWSWRPGWSAYPAYPLEHALISIPSWRNLVSHLRLWSAV
jgi:hypothetical protein